MAVILEHPDKDVDFKKETFEFAEGEITIKATNGCPLTFYQCVGMLEAVKATILKAWLDDTN